MQRTADADRIIAGVPWSAQKRESAEEIYYDAVVHDAQLLYLLARHFPNRLEARRRPALETISAAVSGNRTTSLSAAYTLLASRRVRQGARRRRSGSGSPKSARTAQSRTLTLPADAMPKVEHQPEPRRKCSSRRKAHSLAYYAVNESGFDRNPPAAESTKVSRSSASFSTQKATC